MGNWIAALLVLYSARSGAKNATASAPGYSPMCFFAGAKRMMLQPFQKVGMPQDKRSSTTGIAARIVS